MKAKFLLSFLTIFLLTLTLAESVYAVNELRVKKAASSAAQKQMIRQEDKVANLKKRATSEIDRRVKALNALKERVSGLKRLSDSQKAEFAGKIQTEIDGLTALKAKIEAETDLETLKADVQSIVKSYRIFAFFMPQIQILVAADSLGEAADLLVGHADKLTLRVTEAKTAGHDVTGLEAKLSDMRSQIDLVKNINSQIESSVVVLTPEGFPGNKAALQVARSSLGTARKALDATRQDAASIRNGLLVLKK